MGMYVVDSRYCGSKPTITNRWSQTTLNWLGSGSGVASVTLDIRKVDNAWRQTGCFSLKNASSVSYYNVPASYTIPPHLVDYDSLYIAKLWWADSNNTEYYNKDGDCYFTLQPSEQL